MTPVADTGSGGSSCLDYSCRVLYIEWSIASMGEGPVVGSYVSQSLEGCWNAVESAFFLAIGPSWGPIHTDALRALEKAMRQEGLSDIAYQGSWDYRSTGVVVSLTPA